MVKASIWRPLVARSPLAASCTCCRSFWRSRISSSMVRVPRIERRDPSSTFLTMEATCAGFASRKRSAALRSDSTSRPILNVATPWTWTLMPWLVTASLSCTLICRAVSLSRPIRLSSGITIVPPPTTTFTPLSPGVDTTRPCSSRTLAPREPATMIASLAPATLYRLATNARIRMMMTTPVTTMKGDVAAKLGIGPCSFSSRDRAGDDNEVPAGDGHDLDHASRGYFGIGGGGHGCRGAREADEDCAEIGGRDADPHTAGLADHGFPAGSCRPPRPPYHP